MRPIVAPTSTSAISTTASRRRCRSFSAPRSSAKPAGSAMRSASRSTGRRSPQLDDEMLVNAIAQVAPFDVGAKQALLEQATLDGRADLLVQLMQFHRAAVSGGVEIEPTLQ